MAVLKHIVALSGGKDSTAMALRLQETQPETDFTFVCSPTGNELPEMISHWDRLGKLLKSEIHRIQNPLGLVAESVNQKCLPNWRMRWCTRILKIKPFQEYLLENSPAYHYVGIRSDEAGTRDGMEVKDSSGIINKFPLVEWGWGLKEVMKYLSDQGVGIPERTDCALCFFQRLSEWWRLWLNYPEKFEQGIRLEKHLGHTFRSEQRDSWPASLEELKQEFDKGKVPRGADQMTMELGTSGRSSMCSICAR